MATRETFGTSSLNELHLLSKQLWGHQGQSEVIFPWPRNAGHESGGDGVDGDCHDDGNRRGRLLRRQNCRCRCRNDYIHFEANELAGELRKTFSFLLCPSILDGDVLGLSPAQLMQAQFEGLKEPMRSWV